MIRVIALALVFSTVGCAGVEKAYTWMTTPSQTKTVMVPAPERVHYRTPGSEGDPASEDTTLEDVEATVKETVESTLKDAIESEKLLIPMEVPDPDSPTNGELAANKIETVASLLPGALGAGAVALANLVRAVSVHRREEDE